MLPQQQGTAAEAAARLCNNAKQFALRCVLLDVTCANLCEHRISTAGVYFLLGAGSEQLLLLPGRSCGSRGANHHMLHAALPFTSLCLASGWMTE
jgi:hypothetical protein